MREVQATLAVLELPITTEVQLLHKQHVEVAHIQIHLMFLKHVQVVQTIILQIQLALDVMKNVLVDQLKLE